MGEPGGAALHMRGTRGDCRHGLLFIPQTKLQPNPEGHGGSHCNKTILCYSDRHTNSKRMDFSCEESWSGTCSGQFSRKVLLVTLQTRRFAVQKIPARATASHFPRGIGAREPPTFTVSHREIQACQHLNITKFLGVIQCFFHPHSTNFPRRCYNLVCSDGETEARGRDSSKIPAAAVITGDKPQSSAHTPAPPHSRSLGWLQLLLPRNGPMSCCSPVPWNPQDTLALVLLAQHSWGSRRRNTSL